MFTGFTPEAFDFLWGIRLNNNRDWFLEHKKQYITQVYEPMKALGGELFEPFAQEPGTRTPIRRAYGCVSARTWSGGPRPPACPLR